MKISLSVVAWQGSGLSLPDGAFILDLQQLPPGVYFLRVAEKHRRYRFKVIKH